MTKKKNDSGPEAVPEVSKEPDQIAELTELLQRLQAEFENYKKRVEKDFERQRNYSNHELIRKLLPIFDSLEAALKHTENKEEFVNGIKMIHGELMKLLEKEGLRPIECLGKHFDPYCQEVLLQEPSDKEGIVLEELQKGYMLKDAVLRCAKVKIGKEREPSHANHKKDKSQDDPQAGKKL